MRICINGQIFFSGDYIVATIPFNYVDEEQEYESEVQGEDDIFGRIFVKDNTVVYLCQNLRQGEECKDDNRYGYDYSWHVKIDIDGNIASSDTFDIRHATIEEITENWKKITKSVEDNYQDDDPMPTDWTSEEKLPF